MRKIIFVFTALLAVVANAQKISLDDVMWYRYSEKTIYGMRPYMDGESFTKISDDRSRIERYSYATGQLAETLFDRKTARGEKIAAFSNYIISPNGKTILIETNRKAIYRRSYTAEYYIYDIRNNTLSKLSNGGPQECPKFSPDGNVIGFVRDNNIFLVKLLFNNAESQVTKDGEYNKIINGKPDWVYEEEFEFNQAFDFSADSEMLAWIRFDESKVNTFSFPVYAGEAPRNQQYSLYPGEYTFKYPKAGERNSDVSVHTYDIKARVERKMELPIDSDGYVARIQFTGDKDKLAILTQNRHQDRLDIYMANPRSTVCQLIVRDTPKYFVETKVYNNIDFSRDKFVLMSERDGYNHLYLYTINGTLVKQLTHGEKVITDYYGTDESGTTFYYASTEGNPLEKYICKVDMKGKETVITRNKGTNTAHFSNGCKFFVNEFSDINTPRITAVYNNTGKQLRVLEDNKELKDALANADWAQPEIFSFTTSEGVQLNGWMLKPTNFNPSKKYPVLMYQYSGPGAQEVSNSFNNGFFGNLSWEQRLVQKGYIVVCVDGRGTGGRGAEFQKCTYMTMGDKESKDQVEVALYLGQQPYVDKEHIAIWGWSFGGFNTLMSMCEGRNVFCCGVAVAPVTDWRFYDSVYTERYMRTPQENPTGYDISPLHRYKKLHGKLLLCHGMADDNVHFQNAAELIEKFVQQGTQFEMQFYTNRNHGISGGNTRKHLFTRIEEFLDKNMLNDK